MSRHYLATPLRRVLEKTIKEARMVAQAGAADAIRRLGVVEGKAPAYLTDSEQELRRRLRAHARALGDPLNKASGEQNVKRLVEAAAYAQWHRMLFARFLAERGLLRHPEHNVPVTIEDCREIAQEEGAADAWAVAERYAAAMLPAVFRIDDPVLSLTLDPAQGQALHRLVTDLDNDVFQAEDSLGWTYQFWRAAEKDAVNKKGDKIGADEISAVTQLFTEPYMVRFLLHNTLGAWWAGKVLAGDADLAKNAADEEALRAACSLPGYSFDMLRFVREGGGDAVRWRPAAGAFPGWPTEAKAITVLDPCCGSGHFLTEALTILVTLRQAEEGLSPSDAVAAVLRDNLHGLEIDGRCVQIAAFAVALTAWRIGGWQPLPLPHIAWVGAPPPLPKADFMALANGDPDLRVGLAALHDMFIQAPILGSLIEPRGGDLGDHWRLGSLELVFNKLLEKARGAEPEFSEGAFAAQGMAHAAALLGGRYVLQVTNVPFLGRAKQHHILVEFIERYFEEAKADLATAMLSRMATLSTDGGTVSAVAPQNWFFLGRYQQFRYRLLETSLLNFLVGLGSGAFESISGEVVNTGLICISNSSERGKTASHLSLDANGIATYEGKQEAIRRGPFNLTTQDSQRRNPDARFVCGALSETGPLLGNFAISMRGIVTGDGAKWVRNFWESPDVGEKWRRLQSTPEATGFRSGKSFIIDWETDGAGMLRPGTRNDAYGKSGVALGQIGRLPATLYEGALYDNNTGVIVPHIEADLPALWCFCSSSEFETAVRRIDQKMNVTNATFLKVPFDRERWRRVAAVEFPNGLPQPYSEDPTQWLFHGHPASADKGTALHVALARLSGYRWPAETDRAMRLATEAREWITKAAALPEGDHDGLLSVAGVAGEKPLADRLRGYLAAAFGLEWSNTLERRLVADADEVLDKRQAKDGSLDAWLRDRAFRQHCALFHQRPFLWHIWDGLKDGFSVFVHYHRFSQGNLRKLTYTMLGDWLARAKAESNDLRFEKGRELQQTLEKVLEGEAPFDIFVRWKPMAQQPLGWDADLDDGVRMNIRPFMEAGILREQPRGIKWVKDRGNDVSSSPWYQVFKGERINDHHTTLEEKRVARAANLKKAAAK